MKNNRPLLAFIVVGVLGAGIGVATAQVTGDFGTPPRLVPYSGFLEDSGLPVSGAVDLSFFIVTSPATGSAGAVWQEDLPAVVVSGGSFSVLLGQSTPFGTLFADAGELYVGVSIDGFDLAGRQRIASAPYGISAGEARNFTVRGVLNAEGAVNVAGTTTLNGATNINGALNVPTVDPVFRGTMMSGNYRTFAGPARSESQMTPAASTR